MHQMLLNMTKYSIVKFKISRFLLYVIMGPHCALVPNFWEFVKCFWSPTLNLLAGYEKSSTPNCAQI